MRLLTPALTAIASILAPPRPTFENSAFAAARIFACVCTGSRMRFAGCARDGLRGAFSFAGVVDIASVSEVTGERMGETLPLGAVRPAQPGRHTPATRVLS